MDNPNITNMQNGVCIACSGYCLEKQKTQFKLDEWGKDIIPLWRRMLDLEMSKRYGSLLSTKTA